MAIFNVAMDIIFLWFTVRLAFLQGWKEEWDKGFEDTKRLTFEAFEKKEI